MRHNTSIRLFVDAPLFAGAAITLEQQQSHYLANVMRAKLGDTLLVFNGKDGEWSALITAISKKSLTLEATAQAQEQKKEPDVWLVFAPIKKARIDFIAQKATELGTSHLQPIYTQRTIVDRVKTDRLHANAVEAAEQCERLTVPTVAAPAKLETLLSQWPEDRHIMFCDEDLSGEPAHHTLRDIAEKSPTAKWAIFIGPEGGFTDTERSAIKAKENTHVVSLGPRILRADTAAMAALALWQSALGDW